METIYVKCEPDSEDDSDYNLLTEDIVKVCY